MNDKLKLGVTAIGKNVVVVLDPKKEKTEGGIEIPDQYQTTEQWGIVASIGKECQAHVGIGDRVFIAHHQGTHVQVDGISYILIEGESIMAKEW